jgi:hypothetical protein
MLKRKNVENNRTISPADGGTGATNLSGVVIANGLSPFTAKANPTGAFIGDTDPQTMSNKTLTSPTITPALTVPNGGTGVGTLTGVAIGNGTSAFTSKTNPSGAFVGTTDIQTLTNKTLTDPLLNISTILSSTNCSLDQVINFTPDTAVSGSLNVTWDFFKLHGFCLAFCKTQNAVTLGGAAIIMSSPDGAVPSAFRPKAGHYVQILHIQSAAGPTTAYLGECQFTTSGQIFFRTNSLLPPDGKIIINSFKDNVFGTYVTSFYYGVN